MNEGGTPSKRARTIAVGIVVGGSPVVIVLAMKVRRMLTQAGTPPTHPAAIYAGVIGALVLGCTLGGVLYLVVGRRIRRAGWVGAHAAGLITALPCVLGLEPFLHLRHGVRLFAPLDGTDLAAVGPGEPGLRPGPGRGVDARRSILASATPTLRVERRPGAASDAASHSPRGPACNLRPSGSV